MKKQLKGTKEKTRMTLNPVKDVSPFGEKEQLSFGEYIKDWGFLTPSKTKKLLDPYFQQRIKFSP